MLEEYKVEFTETSVVRKVIWRRAHSPEDAIESVKTVLGMGDMLESSPNVYIEGPDRFDFTVSKVKYIKENTNG